MRTQTKGVADGRAGMVPRPVLIFAIVPEGIAGQTVHTVGPPPEGAESDHLKGGERMPPARILLGEESERAFFLLRYAQDGEFAGDTFHTNIDELKEMAEWEYGRSFEWREVPPDVKDPVAFALSHLRG